jgi:hypothetical protein
MKLHLYLIYGYVNAPVHQMNETLFLGCHGVELEFVVGAWNA